MTATQTSDSSAERNSRAEPLRGSPTLGALARDRAAFGLSGVAAFGLVPGTTLEIGAHAGRSPRPAAARDGDRRRHTPAGYWHHDRIRRGDTIGSVLSRARRRRSAALDFLRTNPSARRALSAASRARRSTSRPTRTGGCSRCTSSPATAIGSRSRATATGSSRRPRRRRPKSAGRWRPARSARRCSAPPTPPACPMLVTLQLADVFGGDIDFYQDLRRGDRFTRRLRDALRRRRGDRRRAASSPRSSRTAAGRSARSSGAPTTAPRTTTREDGAPLREGVPALADGVLARDIRLLERALPPDPADVARAQGRRLRGADRARRCARPPTREVDASPGTQNGYGNVIEPAAPRRVLDALRAPVALRAASEERRARDAGRRHRLRRADRLGNGTASALRVSRRPANSAIR